MSMINRELTANGCTQVQGLAPGHPVFKLDFPAGSVVVKCESGNVTNGQLRNNAVIMRFVDKAARTVVLKRAEVEALKTIARNLSANELRDAARGNTCWVKMDVKQNLQTLGDAGAARVGGNKEGVRRFASTLNAPGGLEKLGKIIAADAFNGSSDRFGFDDEPGAWFPDYGVPDAQRLTCLQNVGNVFVASGKTGDEVVGLDMYDPSSPYKDWTQDLRRVENDNTVDWPGRILADTAADKARRRQFAEKVVADLEIVLGERNRKIAFTRTSRLPKGAAGRIVAGMEAGAERLKQKLVHNGTTVDPNPKLGLRQRLEVLGWI